MNRRHEQHRIDFETAEDEIRKSKPQAELVGSYGDGSRKSLLMLTDYSLSITRPSVHFQVTSHRVTVYEGGDLRDAIERYNALP